MKNPAAKWPFVALAALLVCGAVKQAEGAGQACFQDGVRGITLAAWGWGGAYSNRDSDTAIKYIHDESANMVVLLRPYRVGASDQITPDKQTPGDADLRHAIQTANANGLGVALKLHFVDARKGDVLANSNYVPQDPAAFFASYKDIVLQNAKFAQANGVKLLVLGTEMGGGLTADPQFKPMFEDVIAAVRQAYRGKITYATQISTHAAKIIGQGDAFAMSSCIDKQKGGNWCIESDEGAYLSFWSDLDYIGLDLYPNFTKQSAPSKDDLKAGITNDADGQNVIVLMQGIQSRNSGKPILITEIGAASVDSASSCSGCWPDAGKPPNPQRQADIFAAEAETLCKEKGAGTLNLAGILWYALDAYKNDNARKSASGVDDTGYTFQNKPAADVVRAVFGAGP